MTIKDKAKDINKVFDELTSDLAIDIVTFKFLAEILEDMAIPTNLWEGYIAEWSGENIVGSVKYLDDLGKMYIKVSFRVFLIEEIQKRYSQEFKEMMNFYQNGDAPRISANETRQSHSDEKD